MNFSQVFSESVAFTRATLFDKWTRWLILILLALPWLALSFVVDVTKIIDSTTIRWDLIPWGQVVPLVLAGIVCSFFFSGYIVRLLRGGDTPPEFDHWAVLALDGIRMDVILLVWVVPVLVLVLLQVMFFYGGGLTGGSLSSPLGLLLLMPVLLIIEFVLLVIAVLYGIIGIIRFARTGSVREAFAFSAIGSTIGRIGRVNYIIALVVLIVIGFVFSFITGLLARIPSVGIVIPACLDPLLAVFRCRFISDVYDSSKTVPEPEPSPVPTTAGTVPPPAGAPAKDLVKWVLVLVVLLAICIIPFFLLLAATGLFPLPVMTPQELEQAKQEDISVYSHEGYFANPLFTRDGTHIVYTASTRPEVKPEGREFGIEDWEDDIWIMSRNGTNQTRVTRVGDIREIFLDPVSDTIAYNGYKDGNISVFTVKDAGSAPARVPGPLPYMYFSSWSPDGNRFAATGYNSSDIHGWGIKVNGDRIPANGPGWSRLFVMYADGANPKEIAKVSTGREFDFRTESTWSPDGSRIVAPLYNPGEPGLGVIDTATGSIVKITRGVGQPASPLTQNGDRYPRWSPTGDRIAFIRNGDVWTVSPDGSGERMIRSDGTVETLAWSPDGSRLAFSADGSLGVMDADGQNLSRIANIRPGPLSWSPDGTTLVYAPGMGGRIRIMSLSPGVVKMGEYITKEMERFSQARNSSST